MNKQAMTFEIGARGYTAELTDQFRHAGRPIDRYEIRAINDDGDREFFGAVECPRSATVAQRHQQIVSEVSERAEVEITDMRLLADPLFFGGIGCRVNGEEITRILSEDGAIDRRVSAYDPTHLHGDKIFAAMEAFIESTGRDGVIETIQRMHEARTGHAWPMAA